MTIAATSSPQPLQRWWNNSSIRFPILIFIAARVLTLLIGVFAVQMGPVNNPYVNDRIFVTSLQARQLSSPLTPLVEPWHRWDTGWYLKIAQFGYAADDGSIIFAPLYPALMAIVGAVVGDKLLAGLIISSIASLAFLIILYKLAFNLTNSHHVAQNALIALITFPTAFYLMAAYTESTFLAFAAGAILAVRHNRWWLAAVLAACAALTRLQGWILFFPISWIAFVTAPRFWQAAGLSWIERVKQAIPRLAAMGAGPLAALGFMLYVPLAGLGSISEAYKTPWGMDVRPPWAAVIDVIAKVLAGNAELTEIAGLIALIIIVVLTLASLRILPIADQLYVWVTLVFILLRYYPRYLLNGTMRYVLDFFPLFTTAGVIFVRYPILRFGWILIGILLQMFMLFLFARWMWIS